MMAISKKVKIQRAMLVYQAGIANVFDVSSFSNRVTAMRTAIRLMQSDFRTCEAFARGLEAGGVLVRTAHCNQAGDIANCDWSSVLEDAPFSGEFRPVGGVLAEGVSR